MEKIKVKQTDLIGDIKDFPVEVVQKMVERQVEQGNEADVAVFQGNRTAGCHSNGFDWINTPEGKDFWENVASKRDFVSFFKVYPQEEAKEEEQPKPAPDIPEGLRPFDVQKAKDGAEVVTRDGKSVRIISYDRVDKSYPIVGLVMHNDGRESVHIFNKLGKWQKIYSDDEDFFDLFIKPVKQTGWVNLYKDDDGIIWVSDVYLSREDAEKCRGLNRIATCKIGWEE